MNPSAKNVVIDAGPLVALLSEESQYHEWAVEQWNRFEPPVFVCEAVITEAAFLLKREDADPDGLFKMLERGAIEISFSARDFLPDLRVLMQRYRNLPMSFADACIVRMSELDPSAFVFTFDSDFKIYRKHGNRVIPVLMPPNR